MLGRAAPGTGVIDHCNGRNAQDFCWRGWCLRLYAPAELRHAEAPPALSAPSGHHLRPPRTPTAPLRAFMSFLFAPLREVCPTTGTPHEAAHQNSLSTFRRVFHACHVSTDGAVSAALPRPFFLFFCFFFPLFVPTFSSFNKKKYTLF